MSNPADLSFDATIRVRDTCLCLHVQRAARALARRFDEALRPVGLTNGQFSLVMSLNRPEPPRISDVAALLAMDRTTLTAALKPLERRGLVVVTVDETDRRGRRLLLTPAGREHLDRGPSAEERQLPDQQEHRQCRRRSPPRERLSNHIEPGPTKGRRHTECKSHHESRSRRTVSARGNEPNSTARFFGRCCAAPGATS